MAYPVNRPISEIAIVGHMADLATANSTAYIVATHRGRLVRAYSIIANAITTADATITVNVNGTEVGEIVVTQSGSAAGDVDSATFNALSTANYVNEGDLITFVSDGEADTTTITRCTAVIDRRF
jgi:transketolase C-terminal domain/subunit